MQADTRVNLCEILLLSFLPPLERVIDLYGSAPHDPRQFASRFTLIEYFLYAFSFPFAMRLYSHDFCYGWCSIQQADRSLNCITFFDVWAHCHPWNGHIFGNVHAMTPIMPAVVTVNDGSVICWKGVKQAHQ